MTPDDTALRALTLAIRSCMGIDAHDNARHDFGDINGGSLQRSSEVAHELLAALSDEGYRLTGMKRKIAVLAIDTGDYHVYVGYFSDVEALSRAVAKLNAERLDMDAMEPAAAEVRTETLRDVPDVIDDDFLDLLAGLLSEAGPEIERASDVKERLEEEAQEREAERQEKEAALAAPVVPSPGQERMEL